ncbi:MAG: cysteine methyltransferase [Firmicutes bacterium HGW-Firmicutes-7]|nr:MAG: cysteine methyltransferase [Firmicutes bacterium HGW-Firmicutes-7]
MNGRVNEINKSNLFYGYLSSPVGNIEICACDDSIISVSFVEALTNEESNASIIQQAKVELTEYFLGKRNTFDVKYTFSGTEFQKSVWKALTEIPYGQTVSYGFIANKIGNKKASRAVGGANNKNKLAIIVPCHRVIGANNKLVGYAGGLWRKEGLLKIEADRKF